MSKKNKRQRKLEKRRKRKRRGPTPPKQRDEEVPGWMRRAARRILKKEADGSQPLLDLILRFAGVKHADKALRLLVNTGQLPNDAPPGIPQEEWDAAVAQLIEQGAVTRRDPTCHECGEPAQHDTQAGPVCFACARSNMIQLALIGEVEMAKASAEIIGVPWGPVQELVDLNNAALANPGGPEAQLLREAALQAERERRNLK